MKQRPRDPSEPIIGRSHWRAIAGYGGLLTAAVLGAFALAFAWLEMDAARAVTVSFLTLAFGQLWHVFNMRERHSTPWRNEVVGNRWVWGALALCVGLLIAAVYVPTLAIVLKVSDPGPRGWGLIIGMSLLPLILGQLAKAVQRLWTSA
jgi:Ca2+-transporting ATPase